MRLITLLSVLIFAASCGNTKNATTRPKKLNGNWIPVAEEIGGTALPKASFSKQELVINNGNYTFTAESVDKGVVVYNGNKMDIYGKEGVNTGKHFMAIYKFANGELTICYNLKGDGYPNIFDTKGKPLYFLCVFKKK